MRRSKPSNASRLVVAAALALVLAQSASGVYAVRSVISAGGGSLQGGSFQLDGTFGQAPAVVSAGAGLHLYSGFWAADSDSIFANGFN